MPEERQPKRKASNSPRRRDVVVVETPEAEAIAEEVIYCPNEFCKAQHPHGTMICDRCQSQLLVEEPDWSEEVPPELAGHQRIYQEGENPVIDQLAKDDSPYVLVQDDGTILASPEAQVLAANPSRVQQAMETKVNARMNYILEQRKPSTEKWFWSHTEKDWADAETHRKEDYNRSSNRARNWCRKNLTREQWQEDWDPLWIRFYYDEEYLAQMVVRDSLSPDPTLLSPDVQAKARRVAERTGALAAILQFHAVAYANIKASADDGTCKAQEEGGGNSIDAWLFMLFIFILGMKDSYKYLTGEVFTGIQI
jgi:hypothetical protein